MQTIEATASACPFVLRQTNTSCRKLAENDFVFVPGQKLLRDIDAPGLPDDAVAGFVASWDELEPDRYMADGGSYRLRRHATFTAEPSGGAVRLEPHAPHYQKVAYNQLNGGIERHFAPIPEKTIENPAMQALLDLASQTFGGLAPWVTWHVEAHQFRIEAVPDGGKPTPEGVHRDGVHFVLMTMIRRENVVNGETSIHDLDGRRLTTFTLLDPFDSAMVNDERVMHGVTPILHVDPGRRGYRDVLVLTFRRK